MLKLFKSLRKREWILVLVSLVFIILQVFLDLKLPDYMAQVTRLVQTPGSQLKEIFIEGLKMMGVVFGSVLTSIIVGFFATRVAASFSANLRQDIFEKIDSFSMEEMNGFSTPSLITRTTNDVSQVQMVITLGLQVMLKAPIMAVWAILKIYDKGVEWSFATFVAVVVLLVVVTIAMIIVMPKFKKMQLLTDDINQVTRESLTGLRVIRAYNAEAYQDEKFETVNEALTQTQLFTSRAMSMMMPFITLIMSTITLVIYWIGAGLIEKAAPMEKLTLFSDMVVFSSYAMQVLMAFMLLVMIFVILPRASISAKRIREILDEKPKIISGNVTEGLPGLKGQVEFKNVYFKYPDAKDCVIENISFKVKEGETIAFIGSTGSGKSTLINLVPRFFDATQGQVLINGVDVRDYDLHTLYNKIGYVPQKAVLFSGSIKSNVDFGEHESIISQDDIEKAIKIAQAENFVLERDDTYDAEIARGGENVSGGQKQRISIARAIAKKPEIYIFDDSFSALDYKTDRALRSALKKETKGVTSMIVAQRIGTILDADQIVVLDQGRMVGKGTHDELMKSCEVYQEIAKSQFSEEELV